MRLSSLLISLSAALAISMMAQGCSLFGGNDATSEDRICTPGAFVFCRCADRAEGTKLCKQDGQSFEACATSTSGECVGGEIPDERTNQELPGKPPPGKTDPPNAIDNCPGKSVAVLPGVDLKLEGDTTSGAYDREGKTGACAVGAGAKDHIYRLIPSGSGQLEVSVQGEGGLNPVAYIRTTCDDKETQVDCAPAGAGSLTQLRTNVKTGVNYFLVIDGASGSAGKYVAMLHLMTKPFCGDGKVDDGEACDDGAHVEEDGCSADCRKVNGNPTSGGGCPGHPVHLWAGRTVTGTGSTNGYGNAWDKPSAACESDFTNTYQDHIYEITPHATGTMTVTVMPTAATNFMLSARRTCTDVTTTSTCKNDEVASTNPESMTVGVKNGEKIYVAVDGGGITSNKGDYTISFSLK